MKKKKDKKQDNQIDKYKTRYFPESMTRLVDSRNRFSDQISLRSLLFCKDTEETDQLTINERELQLSQEVTQVKEVRLIRRTRKEEEVQFF